MTDIQEIRNKINIIDKKIVGLLKKRLNLLKIISKIKLVNKINLRDKKREKQILSQLKNPFLKSIFRLILKKSLEEEKKFYKNNKKAVKGF